MTEAEKLESFDQLVTLVEKQAVIADAQNKRIDELSKENQKLQLQLQLQRQLN